VIIMNLYAILTTPAVFIGTHPALAFVGAAVELGAIVIGLVRLHRRDIERDGRG
jgi:hypothetical protein